MKIWNVAFLSLATALISCASQPKTEEPKAPPTLAEVTAANMQRNQAEYVTRTQARIDELKNFGNQLRAQAAKVEKPRAKKLSNAADDLDTLLSEVSKQLEDVKAATPANWIDEKRDVDQAMSMAESKYSNSVRLLK